VPKPQRARLEQIRVDEVSFVDKGANPGAHICLWKRAQEGEPEPDAKRSWLDKAVGWILRKEWTPQSFEEVREEWRSYDIAEAIDSRLSALGSSIHQILNSDESDKEGLLRVSLQQFSSAMDDELSDLLAGRILKNLASWDGPPEAAEVAKRLDNLLSEISAEGSGGTDVKDQIDLSKLTDEQREQLRQLVATAKKAQEAEARAKAAEDALAKAGDESDDGLSEEQRATLKALSPELRKIIEPLLETERKGREALHVQVVDLTKAARRRDLTEIVKAYTGISVPESEFVDFLEKADGAGLLDELRKVLDPANAAASRVFDVLGSDQEGALGDAEQKLHKLATDLNASNSEQFPTYEQAYAEITKRNPELAEEAIEEAH
jgi:adenylate kinase family enzyme